MLDVSKRLAAGGLLCVLAVAPARADYHIYSPYEIDLGALEIETNGDAAFDRQTVKNGGQSYTIELGTGLTSWWHSEIEFGFNRDPGFAQPTALDSLVSENMIQLSEPGEDWADTGVYFEYGQNVAAHGANEFTIGPVVGKDIGHFGNILNVFVARQLGPDQGSHGLDLSYAWQTRWRLSAPFSPAVEVYGDLGSLTHTPSFNRQELLAGPVALGVLPLTGVAGLKGGNFKYELGWLFGATGATAAGTLRWRVELELPF